MRAGRAVVAQSSDCIALKDAPSLTTPTNRPINFTSHHLFIPKGRILYNQTISSANMGSVAVPKDDEFTILVTGFGVGQTKPMHTLLACPICEDEVWVEEQDNRSCFPST